MLQCSPPRRRRSSAYHLAEPLERRVLLASFRGVSLQDEFDILGSGPTTSPCPDTMGAVGPNHFLEEIKGAVAVFDKNSGARLSITSLANFFNVTIGGITYPRTAISDPHCVYDTHSGRFFAIALELGATGNDDNGIILAVSRTSDPTGAWDKYFLDVGFGMQFTDYDTLGMDDNGLYFGANMFPGGGDGDLIGNKGRGALTAQIIATPKAPLLAATPSLGTLYQFTGITDMFSVQPAFNFDHVGPSDKAWFVSSSVTSNSNVNYRTLTWSGGVPTLSATQVVTTPDYGNPINAPAQGSTTPLNVVDDRLNMSVIRDGHLWTVRNVGMNATGGAIGSNRTGVEWVELNTSGGTTATLDQSGRIWDPAASSPRFYYVPSLNVNAKGDVRIGFSGSKSTEFIGAYISGRAPGDAAGFATAPQLIKAGEAAYQRIDGSGRNRWGDFSYTSIDPTDDLTIWTIQEYASTGAAGNIWGTWIMSTTPNGVWDAGGDAANWNDAANWSNDTVPGTNDSVVIRPNGSPTITITNANTRVFSLTLGNTTTSSPTLALAPGGNKLLQLTALTINGNSKLDLNDNDMIVDYTGASPLASIQSLINSARAGGAWTGSGITSGSARNNPAHNTTLGAMEATDYKSVYGPSALFDGQSIDNTAVLVKYTYYGDADFNGKVNFDDYVRTDNGFSNHLSGWLNGDYDGNGVVNFDDYVLIDLAFNTQSGTLGRFVGARR
jgi:hypothetical protein